jgi:stage II sporulation protein D
MRRGYLLLTALLLSSCAAPPRGIQDYRNVLKQAPVMRVALVLDERQATVGVAGPFKVYSAGKGDELLSCPRLPPCAVQASGEGLCLGDRRLAAGTVRIVPERDGSLYVNGRYYRGELLMKSSSGLTILNLVDMERYLAGVVGSEAVESWPDDALRAQAVVARTYALNQKKSRDNKAFDVQATVADQVYLGTERETAKLRRIVKETTGIVLLYKGELFTAYFHSTCGGHTEPVSRAFSSPDIPPLRGVECNYCTSSKYYGWWSATLDAESLSAALRKAGKRVGHVTDIEPMDIGPSGRAARVRITHDRGTTVVGAYEFRKIVGANQIRNTNFLVRKYGDTFQFVGRGWGHGVGMCQFGAKGIAEKGYGFTAILKYYYPGATLARLY